MESKSAIQPIQLLYKKIFPVYKVILMNCLLFTASNNYHYTLCLRELLLLLHVSYCGYGWTNDNFVMPLGLIWSVIACHLYFSGTSMEVM